MEKRELYAYTTPIYKDKGLIKVGETSIGYKERIKNQQSTSNPEPTEDELIGILPLGITDRHIHKQLEDNGHIRLMDGAGKEWFKATFDDVRQAYNMLVFGSNRPLNHKLRKEQQLAVEKSTKWFTNGYEPLIYKGATYKNRFLLNAKMRFGKCFTGIHIAKSIGARNILIVTYKPDVIGEWIDEVNKQVDFDGWLGIRARKKHDRMLDPCLDEYGNLPEHDGPIVLCVSLQDLAIHHGQTKNRLHKILKINWDLIIFDEVHFGSRTERTKYILDSISYANRLDLSGTPFRIIEEDDFCTQQVFTYSYLDEQDNKKEEILNDPYNQKQFIYRQMPNLNISTIEVTAEDINNQREVFSSDDLDFSLNRLFETQNGTFAYEESVDQFLDGLTKCGHDARSISVFGKLGSKLGTPAIRHTVWWLKRVESVNALALKLKKHPYFSKFLIINAAGSKTSSTEEINFITKEKSQIEKAIRKVSESRNLLGTITLTCGRFLTGITIKEWDSILVLCDTDSPESYFQAIFRVQSSWFDKSKNVVTKPQAWVFDFAISRCLKIIYDCANCIADQIDQQKSYEQTFDYNNDSLEMVTAGLCDTLDVKRFIEGSLESLPTKAKDIFDALEYGGSRLSLARRITSNVLVNFNALKLLDEHPHLLEILKNVKGYRTQDISVIDINNLVQIGIDADVLNEIKLDEAIPTEIKESMLQEFIEKDKDKDRQTRKKWYATQIKRLAICMADFIYMTYEREYNIYDVIETKSPHFFEVMTGINKDEFNELCNKGFLNIFSLNRIVREFHDQENHSLYPEQYILNQLIGKI